MGAERCGACEAYDMRTGGARYARACKIYVTINQIKFIMEKEINPMKNEKKMNNKGFSLVELIIVIAIMAVLIGVLAPQYLKYVEKSRQSADLDNIDQMISAVEIYSADPAHDIVDGTITYAGGAATAADADILSAFKEAGLPGTTDKLPKMKSKAYSAWSIEFDSTGVTVTDNDGDSDTATNLATALGR